MRREILDTADGDELVLDHAAGSEGSPRVLVVRAREDLEIAREVDAVLAPVGR